MGKALRNIVAPLLVILVGVGILMYPSVSNYLIEVNGSRAVSDYDAAVQAMPKERYDQLIADARAYNERLAAEAGGVDLVQGEAGAGLTDAYNALLNVNGDGMMGYLTIPRLSETMPVYHGVEEPVLQKGAGHLPDTSLPVGGPSTHAVLSGHRGLPSAKLFTDLDKMQQGDVFYLKVLDQTTAYRVSSIETVLPTETRSLSIEPGADKVTLVTCTPYGVNSHRLLVHAVRTDYDPDSGESAPIPPSINMPPWLIGLLVAAGAIVVVVVARAVARARAEGSSRIVKEGEGNGE